MAFAKFGDSVLSGARGDGDCVGYGCRFNGNSFFKRRTCFVRQIIDLAAAARWTLK